MAYIEEKTIPFLTKMRMAYDYRDTLIWLLKKGGLSALYKYLYVKLLVPTGEGAGGLFNPLTSFFYRKFPENAPLPRQIEIEPTTVCPMGCIMCETTYWNEKGQHRTLQEFKKIVDQMPLRWINMNGIGESFLNPEYMQQLEYAKKKNIFINIVDDCRLIDKQTAEKIIKLGIDSFWISFDGATKETYETIRPNFRFENIIENIRTLLRLKKELRSPVPEICFRFIVNTLNVKEMPQFVNLVASLGTRRDFGPASRIEFAGILSFPEIEWLYIPNLPQDLIHETQRRAKQHNLYVVFSHAVEEKLPTIERCIAWMEPVILVDGWVAPCCAVLMSNNRDYLRKHSFGNIHNENFKQIWNSNYYKCFRKMVVSKNAPVPALCQGCRAYNTKMRETKYGIADKNGIKK